MIESRTIESLAKEVLAEARAKGLLLATAESCTGGRVAAALTSIAGSSDVFDCGFVTYSNAAKSRMLNVNAETIAEHGAVSESVAREMAKGAIANSGANIAVSVTGVAGPQGGSALKPVGTVCFAIAKKSQSPHSRTCTFPPEGRSAVQNSATETALKMFIEAIAD